MENACNNDSTAAMQSICNTLQVEALVSTADQTAAPPAARAGARTALEVTNAETAEIPVSSIRIEAAFNPRKHFSDSDIAAFADRIDASGWLQPPLVRPDPNGQGYLLVAGERRMRAITLLGWTTVQVTVKVMTDKEHRLIALAENIDRRDLNVAEEALAARDHLDAYDGDHEAAATALGWPVGRLRHRLKLLHATPLVLDSLLKGALQLGHAELLATMPPDQQDKAAPRIIAEGVTVTALREQINGYASPLASAIFNRQDCSNCAFNTSCQGTLFESRVEDGKCTNRTCFQTKTGEALEAKRKELCDDYGTVILISEKSADSYAPLTHGGAKGVGMAQFDACRSCQFRGAAIHDAAGARQGAVDSPLCFNRTCHTGHVASYQESLKPQPAKVAYPDAGGTNEVTEGTIEHARDTNTAIAAPASTTPEKAPQATLKAVAEKYAEAAAKAAAASLYRHPSAALALALVSIRKYAVQGGSANIDRIWQSAGLPGWAFNITENLIALSKVSPEKLQSALQSVSAFVMCTDPNSSHQFQRLPALTTWIGDVGEKVEDYLRVDKEFLTAHTKPALEALLDKSGFKQWTLSKDGGDKTYRTLIGSTKAALIDSVLTSGYDFTGYLPPDYSEQSARWSRSAGI